MKKVKVLSAAIMLTLAGVAYANQVQPIYVPGTVYNASTGQYVDGCLSAHYDAYNGMGGVSTYSTPAIPNGSSAWLYTTSGSVLLWCDGGMLSAGANENEGYLY